MAAPSKTSARAMGAKGGGGLKADNRAFIQPTLAKSKSLEGHGHPVPRDVVEYTVWRYAHGDYKKQTKITQQPTVDEARSAAVMKGYSVLNPDGGKFAPPAALT